MAEKNSGVIPLTLTNSATGKRISKNVALNRTVAELLMYDSLNLFPDVVSSTFRVRNYEVTLVRTKRLLEHTKTLQDAGVTENDTLEIAAPTPNHPEDCKWCHASRQLEHAAPRRAKF